MRKPTPPRGLVKHIRIGMTQTTIVMCIIAAIVSLQSSLTSSPSHPNNMAIDERVLTVHMFARSMPETVLRMHSSSRIIRTCVRCTLHNTVSSKSVAAFYFFFSALVLSVLDIDEVQSKSARLSPHEDTSRFFSLHF